MKKIITLLLVIFSIFILTGCKKEQEDGSKIYLDSKFYGKSEFIKLKASEFNKINDNAYVVYTYNSYCSLKIPCETIFKEVMDKYDLTFYSLFVEEMNKTFISDTVK